MGLEMSLCSHLTFFRSTNVHGLLFEQTWLIVFEHEVSLFEGADRSFVARSKQVL